MKKETFADLKIRVAKLLNKKKNRLKFKLPDGKYIKGDIIEPFLHKQHDLSKDKVFWVYLAHFEKDERPRRYEIRIGY